MSARAALAGLGLAVLSCAAGWASEASEVRKVTLEVSPDNPETTKAFLDSMPKVPDEYLVVTAYVPPKVSLEGLPDDPKAFADVMQKALDQYGVMTSSSGRYYYVTAKVKSACFDHPSFDRKDTRDYFWSSKADTEFDLAFTREVADVEEAFGEWTGSLRSGRPRIEGERIAKVKKHIQAAHSGYERIRAKQDAPAYRSNWDGYEAFMSRTLDRIAALEPEKAKKWQAGKKYVKRDRKFKHWAMKHEAFVFLEPFVMKLIAYVEKKGYVAAKP